MNTLATEILLLITEQIQTFEAEDQIVTLQTLLHVNRQWHAFAKPALDQILDSKYFSMVVLPPWMKSRTQKEDIRESLWQLNALEAYYWSFRQHPEKYRRYVMFRTIPSQPIGLSWNEELSTFETSIVNDPPNVQYLWPWAEWRTLKRGKAYLIHHFLEDPTCPYLQCRYRQKGDMIMIWWDFSKGAAKRQHHLRGAIRQGNLDIIGLTGFVICLYILIPCFLAIYHRSQHRTESDPVAATPTVIRLYRGQDLGTVVAGHTFTAMDNKPQSSMEIEHLRGKLVTEEWNVSKANSRVESFRREAAERRAAPCESCQQDQITERMQRKDKRALGDARQEIDRLKFEVIPALRAKIQAEITRKVEQSLYHEISESKTGELTSREEARKARECVEKAIKREKMAVAQAKEYKAQIKEQKLLHTLEMINATSIQDELHSEKVRCINADHAQESENWISEKENLQKDRKVIERGHEIQVRTLSQTLAKHERIAKEWAWTKSEANVLEKLKEIDISEFHTVIDPVHQRLIQIIAAIHESLKVSHHIQHGWAYQHHVTPFDPFFSEVKQVVRKLNDRAAVAIVQCTDNTVPTSKAIEAKTNDTPVVQHLHTTQDNINTSRQAPKNPASCLITSEKAHPQNAPCKNADKKLPSQTRPILHITQENVTAVPRDDMVQQPPFLFDPKVKDTSGSQAATPKERKQLGPLGKSDKDGLRRKVGIKATTKAFETALKPVHTATKVIESTKDNVEGSRPIDNSKAGKDLQDQAAGPTAIISETNNSSVKTDNAGKEHEEQTASPAAKTEDISSTHVEIDKEGKAPHKKAINQTAQLKESEDEDIEMRIAGKGLQEEAPSQTVQLVKSGDKDVDMENADKSLHEETTSQTVQLVGSKDEDVEMKTTGKALQEEAISHTAAQLVESNNDDVEMSNGPLKPELHEQLHEKRTGFGTNTRNSSAFNPNTMKSSTFGFGTSNSSTFNPGSLLSSTANPYITNTSTTNPHTSNPSTASPHTSTSSAFTPYTFNPSTANPYISNPFTANPYTSNRQTSNVAEPFSHNVLKPSGYSMSPNDDISTFAPSRWSFNPPPWRPTSNQPPPTYDPNEEPDPMQLDPILAAAPTASAGAATGTSNPASGVAQGSSNGGIDLAAIAMSQEATDVWEASTNAAMPPGFDDDDEDEED
ncbi:uncharacterized protein KY384_007366 [Bacidia gigantensis]|uniref:uncharacterized protein n=1 Tax=Bacidia gigantensis TaxID=2732470 RepID=UPI001D03BCFE|nr:uncharacterized protein KY384_007366 [Bacidia gigantensis]KAG8528448.1 hypothetical protein KY384_007366 [Bacidia gigantensis]